ncbi:DUF305 domain-containing protein [Arthrobacter sp. H14]|uniref:DUF305 domain-containing protein n=1 Tax=Arthrobacter sp. H14 TaxID=1312959 RepID=UPI003FA4692A
MYLELMLTHHEPGIAMAEAVLERSNNPVVTTLAESMLGGQKAEVAYMTDFPRHANPTRLPKWGMAGRRAGHPQTKVPYKSSLPTTIPPVHILLRGPGLLCKVSRSAGLLRRPASSYGRRSEPDPTAVRTAGRIPGRY